MDFKEYPSYKNSGVEWLGDVPEHFDSIKIKQLAISKLTYGANESAEQEIKEHPRYIRITDIKNDGTLNPESFKSLPPEIAEQYLLANNDILFARSGATVGKTFKYSDSWGVCCFAGYLIKLSVNVKIANPDYVFYYLNSYPYWEYIASNQSQSTIQNVSAEKYANFTIAIPKIFEQEKIVAFLDTETTRIDNLITKQEKLIELLEEQRKSIISHAVTKGLNPNAPMKDSGVEWLGEVPEHWSENKIKFVSKLITDKTANKSNVIALENIESWTAKLVSSDSDFDSDGICFKKNDVLFGKLRPYLAKVYLAESRGEAVGDIYVLRPNNLINPKFLKFFMLSEKFIDYVNSSTNGTKMPRANWDFIGSISIFLPHLKVQHEIVEYLESAVLKIELIINKQKSLIEKLKEYRASIISHAVTGKIDVREFGA